MERLVIYFCGISGKFNLDYSNLIPVSKELKNEAKIKGRWYEKVEKVFRIALGNNIGSFHTEQEARAYAEKNFEIPVIKYGMIEKTGITSWQLKKNG